LDIDINNKDFKLIKIYYYVCEKFEESLKFECERFSNNNNNPDLTDQELITIYLFLMNHQGIHKISRMHQFATEYLLSWFPNLGSYQAFNNRLNRMSHIMNRLAEQLIENLPEAAFNLKGTIEEAIEAGEKMLAEA
jgi:hypothetical protein